MAAGDNKTQPTKRRKTRVNLEQEPEAVNIPQPQASEGRPAAMRHTTDGYDAGLIDQQRPGSSVVPMRGTTSSIPRIPHPTQTDTPVPPRKSVNMGRNTTSMRYPRPVPSPVTTAPPTRRGMVHRLKHMHWLFLIGLGMLVALILWTAGSSALSWGMQRYNDLRYGNPRTFHIDSAVGHGDSDAKPSHFIAMNWNHQAVIVEFRAGDPKDSVTYLAPIYVPSDNGEAPITVEFRDVTGDKKVDMIVHIHLPNEQVFVFVNDPPNKKFRNPTSSDNLKI